MNQPSSLELMQDTVSHNLAGTHHQQRQALASISSRSATANVGALDFLRDYFFNVFQAEGAAAVASMPVVTSTAAPTELAAIQCRNCGRAFKSQTALNGHGEARCQGKPALKTGPVLTSSS